MNQNRIKHMMEREKYYLELLDGKDLSCHGHWDMGYHQGRLSALEAVEDMTGSWIPVAERMPEEDGDYLVTMATPGFNKGQPYTNWLCWDGDDQEWTDTDGDIIPDQDTVIAWKLVPEPWEG